MVNITEEKIIIPTYIEPKAEDMPIFAENRVHQRTSGNPYPNHIVLKVDREHKEDREYTCITLENEYIKIQILPELGGRIYSALDKTTGYDFFYKQHVIKPALIGCLGSWVSGGCEFNWPFHHRASTFMPTDYSIQQEDDGTVIVWLSEHDPIERMKGMVGIVLKPGEAKFETRMRLSNRTPVTNSFLWWENAAVPVNKSYQIFYPKDVTYVNFHYKRSVTTYPVASNALGVFNGIRYQGDTDISMHKNTIQPTSYFCAPSKYDFFGGFDHGMGCGVVHVANHHTSIGKKMFTWAYNQLSTSWENALTDTDGAYAELMAGSYSDNQPDFAWIEPYETKIFSQHWYPIGNVGIPCYANLNGAVHWDEKSLVIQTTRSLSATVLVSKDGKKLFEAQADFTAGVPQAFEFGLIGVGTTVTVVEKGKTILSYTEEKIDQYNIPDTTQDMPYYKEVKTAQELYLEGVHVWQYRDPAVLPDVYWKEALLRDPGHIESLNALAMYCYKQCEFEKALSFAKRAESEITKFNKHPQSGRIFFNLGLIYLALDSDDTAYDYLYKSSWNQDCYSAAMTHISAIDGKRGDFENMLYHSECALRLNGCNSIAAVYSAIAEIGLNNNENAIRKINDILSADPLNHLARYVYTKLGKLTADQFYNKLSSDSAQTCLDLAFDLIACGKKTWATELLQGSAKKSPITYYLLGDFEKAESAVLESSFPFRIEEYKLLKNITEARPNLPMAHYYFGCIAYAKRQYKCAVKHLELTTQLKPDFYIPYRNLAVAYYSHPGKQNEVLPLLQRALEYCPNSKQLVYETAYVMCKLGYTPQERIDFILSRTWALDRDDISIELARAYNQNGDYDKALDHLIGHTFVPCEGGEHTVAEQYMFAHFAKGRNFMKAGQYTEAAKEFRLAMVLPQNLGAGLWNECRLVPSQFYLAQCLDALGNEAEAMKLYDHILCLEIDYFSNMHLPELPYYQAMAYKRKGDFLTARALVDKYQKKWSSVIDRAEPGHANTTPFFISYCDAPDKIRKAYYSYLLGYAHRFMENFQVSSAFFKSATSNEQLNLFYGFEAKF